MLELTIDIQTKGLRRKERSHETQCWYLTIKHFMPTIKFPQANFSCASSFVILLTLPALKN